MKIIKNYFKNPTTVKARPILVKTKEEGRGYYKKSREFKDVKSDFIKFSSRKINWS